MFTAIISRMGYRGLGARGLVAVVAVVVVILGVYGRGWDANKARVTEATTLRGEPVFVRAEQQRQAAADRAMVMAEQAREREGNLANPTYGTYSAELAARDLAMVMEEQQRERELILMEAAGLVTLTRPEVTPPQPMRRVFPQELIQMEAAGLVTLDRSHSDRLMGR